MSEHSSWGAPRELAALERRAWLIGAAGLVVTVLGALIDRTQFTQSYLVAWLLWTGTAIGCFAILCLQHLSGGQWGIMARRILEAAAKTIPIMGLLFVPVLLGLVHVYPWADPEVAESTYAIQKKAGYLNPSAFIARFVGYFVLLGGLSWLICRMSLQQDATGRNRYFRRMQRLAGPSLGLYVLIATLASVDWIMSADPAWYSSLFGVYFVGGHAVSAFAFLIPLALWLARREPMSRVFTKRHFHDYGKLLFAFVMLWAYFAVSQLLIIWSGDLAEEVTWYVHRTQGGWKTLSVVLALFHFALPFLVLLSRDIKRNGSRLATIALLLLAMRWVDLYWQLGPTFHHEGFAIHWLDLTTVVGLGGVWLALVLRTLGRHALLPVNDPNLGEVLPSD